MGLIDWIGYSSLTALSIGLVVVMMLARQLGYRFGALRAADTIPDEGISLLVGSVLGLMSFVLAFNLSTSTTRFEDRRDAAVREATAIGTAWLQSRAIRELQGPAISRLLEKYLSARRAYAITRGGSQENEAAAVSTSQLQVEIWSEMTTLLSVRSDPQTVSLANALTHTFDMTTEQNFAIESGLPPRLIWLLLIASMMAISSLGYYLGLLGKPRLGFSVVLAIIWSGVMILILDLGTSRIGTINTDVRPYGWVAEGFVAFDSHKTR